MGSQSGHGSIDSGLGTRWYHLVNKAYRRSFGGVNRAAAKHNAKGLRCAVKASTSMELTGQSLGAAIAG
jgi:hypothetical protein